MAGKLADSIARLLSVLAYGLAVLLRILVYEWVPALADLLRQIRVLMRRWALRRRVPERHRKVSEGRCVPIDAARVSHPDPLIYSQGELMRLGLAVTWDNPDIQIYRNGAAVSSSDLEPATTYEVVARVWNKSTDAPVIGLPVYFSQLSFGIGGHQEPIAAASIPHVGVKGGPDNPAFCSVQWTTPHTPGHYCIQVMLAPVDDADFGNNHGAENTLVGVSHSPAKFDFQLRNDTRRTQVYRFEADTYTIPELPGCSQEYRPSQPLPVRTVGPLMPEHRRSAVPAEHDRASYPIPEGWRVDIIPDRPVLPPGEAAAIEVVITPPAGFHGRQTFNINGFHELGLAGGVTLFVVTP
ncbi:hypothetical protein [Nocardia sp. NPDC005366]|uniref:hypothetical protein n=1 Tax=Nocardia sp. NPDC005366 TaxID=3156878 RepID=UPI0033BEDE8E